jgi:photosystem II stability/assembly factor-like uncharacterized protein
MRSYVKWASILGIPVLLIVLVMSFASRQQRLNEKELADSGLPKPDAASVVSVASAASYRWEQMQVPSAGYMTALIDNPHQKGSLYAGGDVHGFKYTDSFGEQWGLRNSGLWRAGDYGIAAVAPHPTKAGKLYMLSGTADAGNKQNYGFYTSDNNGESWTLLAKNVIPAKPQAANPELRVYGRLIALDTVTGPQDTLYVASYDKGLFKSTDGGKTFAVTGLAGSLGKDKEHVNLTSVILDPANPRNLFVGVRYDATARKDEQFRQSAAGGGVWMSKDAGATWQEVLTGVPVRDLDIDPHNPHYLYAACLDKGVYRSSDGGLSWVPVGSDLPLTTQGKSSMLYNTVTVNPHRTGEVLVGTGVGHLNSTYGSVYRSKDQGQTWTNLAQPGHVKAGAGLYIPDFYNMGARGYAVSRIIIPWWSADEIYVAGRSGVWKSENNGVDWHPIFNGIQGRRLLSSVIQPGTSRFFVGMVDFSMGVYNSATNEFRPVPVKDILDTKDRNIAIAVDASRDKIMAGMGNQYANEGNFGSVIVSTDGEHWKKSAEGLPNKRVSGLKMAPSRPDTAFAVLKGAGIFKTTDGGASWREASKGLTGLSSLFASFTRVPIAIHPTNPDIVYVLDDTQGIYRSFDGGSTWQNDANGIKRIGKLKFNDLALSPIQPDTLFVSTSQGLYRSTDRGSGWTAIPIPNTNTIGPIIVHPLTGELFAAAEADSDSSSETKPGIYRSGDQGNSWTPIILDTSFGVKFDSLLIDPARPDELYATVNVASMVKIAKISQ